MIGRAAVVLAAVLVALLAAISVTQAGAAVPIGPRLAVVTHEACCGAELITVGPTGEAPQTLIVEPASDRPSWSADGSLLAFAATGDDWEGRVVAVARADGSGLRTYRQASLEGEPVISPDGRSVAFLRVQLVKILPGRESYLFKSAIWSLDVEDGSVKRLARWRLAAALEPSSFSPDGSTLAVTYSDHRGTRAVSLDTRSGKFQEIARDAREPAYSPDGTEVAFVRLHPHRASLPEPDRPISELWLGTADGGGARRLVRGRGFISFPSWDPSGSRLSFTRNPPGFLGDLDPEPGNKVMAINADGTCLTKVLTDPDLTLQGAAWQPGLGRDAGPIVC